MLTTPTETTRQTFDFAIAIPARNERSRILGCLGACRRSMALSSKRGALVLMVNNTTDGTDAVARQWGLGNDFPLSVSVENFCDANAHAGMARRRALDLALALVKPEGALLTTDADSIPTPAWVPENLREIAQGAALVCGRPFFDEDEVAALPPGVLETGNSETAYRAMSLELDAILDPDPWNPWPHHGSASGASLAIRADLYQRLGGLPVVPCGEDRAMLRAVRERDLPVRFSDHAAVATSCRLTGRATGGMADTIAGRIGASDHWCDEALEPAMETQRRAETRDRLRKAAADRTALGAELAKLLLDERVVQRAMRATHFGAVWALAECFSPLLVRNRMKRSELERQLPLLEALLTDIRARHQPSWTVSPPASFASEVVA